MNKTKIISVANHKGGVGKTTSVASVGVGLARKGFKVLLVDIDAQANLTSSLLEEEPPTTLYDTLIEGHELSIVHVMDNVDIIPSSLDLSSAELELSSKMDREYILLELLEKGLEKLFSNVQPTEPTEEKEEIPVNDDSAADEQNKTKRGRPALHNKVIRFCTMADDDKVTKIRTIAAREGIAIKDLMNLAFDKIINEYEKKYGTVRLPKVKKGGDVSKVFDLS